MKATFAVCFLVLAITGFACGHEKRQQLPAFCSGSDVLDCLAESQSSPSSICTGDCRDTLEEYVDECLSGAAAEQFLDALDQACPFCSRSDVLDCVAEFQSSPSSTCTGDCRDTLEEYVDECLSGVAAEQFLDALDQACSFCLRSDVLDCVAESQSSPSSICTGDCRDTLEEYVDECLSGAAAEQFLDALDQACSFCLRSDVLDCLAESQSSPSSTCTGDCRDTLEEYVDECLSGAAAEQFLDALDQACSFCLRSDVLDCLAESQSSPSSICTGDCRDTLEEYVDECLSGAAAEQFLDALDQACPFCLRSDVLDCLAESQLSPSSTCTGDCRDTLEEYVDECLSGAAAEQFLDVLDQACEGESDATTATATLISTVTALIVAVAAAFN